MRLFKFLSLFISLAVLLIFTSYVKAAGEFSSTYDTTYSISEDGNTIVEQDITLTNKTDKFFPSSFTLVVPSLEVADVTASDNRGNLQAQTSDDGKNTKIQVNFSNQQIIGTGKQYNFTLRFKDNSIAKHAGKIWTINIPKLNNASDIETFNLHLAVPSGFGDPDYISASPAKTAESGGRIILTFEPNILFNKGISAIFGSEQSFKFESNYKLTNNSLFPKYISIPISLEGSNQKAYVSTIEPLPENTKIDPNGVMLATFKVNPNQVQNVKVTGDIQLFLNPLNKVFLSNSEREFYLKDTRFYDSNSPVIKGKASEVLEVKKDANILEKAEEIDRFVSNFLRFDWSRLEKGDFLRFGSLTALNNPEKALTAEFVDLEVAMLRSAGIPARQVIGFSIPSSEKPFAYSNSNLHSWVELYTDETGWVIADPAWSNTTGGEDFFHFNDLNHLGLAYGEMDLVLPESVKAQLSEAEVSEIKAVELDVQISEEILSGFPNTLKVRIRNLGNTVFPVDTLSVDSSKVLIAQGNQAPAHSVAVETPAIPPFGNIEYDFDLKTGAIWQSYQDAIQISLAGATDTRLVTIKPVLSYRIYAVEIFGALIMILLFYVAVLLIHHRSNKKD